MFITTAGNSVPQIANNTMIHHLEVNGSTRLSGTLNIVEQNGTATGANNGSILLDHENAGGASSIAFRSRANRGSDFGYIQYQDASSVGACGESARLIIGTQNDADDHIILAPSGNVGIGGNNNPFEKLTVTGNINCSANITASSLDINGTIATNNVVIQGPLSCQGAFCTSLQAGSFIASSGNISCVGAIFIGGETWHHAMLRPVFYFDGQGRNYYRGGGSDTAFPPHIWRNGNDTNVLSLTHEGNLRASGGFTNTSDTRIKKDIEDIDDTIGLKKYY